VLGKPIIHNALEALKEAGCTRASIVVGHLADVLRSQLGASFSGLALDYIDNDVWSQTNSMFSLHLGLMSEPADFIIEGDVFFEPRFLRASPKGDIVWFVDSRYRDSDGSYLRTDVDGTVVEQRIERNQAGLDPSWAKSVGILRLTEAGSRRIAGWLTAAVSEGKQQLYYDLILAEHLSQRRVVSHDVAPGKWFEIDTPQDLAAAERRFS
jgi:choline kinase